MNLLESKMAAAQQMPEYQKLRAALENTNRFHEAHASEKARRLEEQLRTFVVFKTVKQLRSRGKTIKKIREEIKRRLGVEVSAVTIQGWTDPTKPTTPTIVNLASLQPEFLKGSPIGEFDPEMAELTAHYLAKLRHKPSTRMLSVSSSDKPLVERISQVISRKIGRQPNVRQHAIYDRWYFRTGANRLAEHLKGLTANKTRVPLEHLLYNRENRLAFLRGFLQNYAMVISRENQDRATKVYVKVAQANRAGLLRQFLPLFALEGLFPSLNAKGKIEVLRFNKHEDLQQLVKLSLLPILRHERLKELLSKGKPEIKSYGVAHYDAFHRALSSGQRVESIARVSHVSPSIIYSWLQGSVPIVVKSYADAHLAAMEAGHTLPIEYPFSFSVGSKLLQEEVGKSGTAERQAKLGLAHLPFVRKRFTGVIARASTGFEGARPVTLETDVEKAIIRREAIQKALEALPPNEKRAFEQHIMGTGKPNAQHLESALASLRKIKELKELI